MDYQSRVQVADLQVIMRFFVNLCPENQTSLKIVTIDQPILEILQN